ncbi:MAG: VOC family protein, partial [Micropruina glycogenica]
TRRIREIPTCAGMTGVLTFFRRALREPSCVRWYSEVLGFAERRRVQVNGMAKAMLIRDDLLITLTEHGEFAEPGPFNERHAGLDHLGVAVADRATLDAWIAHLDGLGVAHGDVTRGATGDLIAFRDPDNIALEFYTRG